MMRIREVQAGDRAEWLRLLMALHPDSNEVDHSPDVDAFLSRANSQMLLPSVVFVSERPGAGLSGLLELSVRNYAEGCSGATPYVESWYVDPDVRRQGIGRRLIAAAERWAVANGYRELASDAELSNTLSHSAHQAVGFSEVERIVVFRKQLSAPGHR